MKEVGIGLLGFGTVGAGVVKGLQQNGDMIAARLGVRPVIRRIADLDVKTDRGVKVDPALLTTDAKAAIESPDVDIVVELIGGTGVARQFVTHALEIGKPVVTANKHLLALHGKEIFDLAAARKADIYFGASVGGGIPIIRALREGLIANQIETIRGILNGTCNYILTRMEQDGLSFEEALREAQAKGYAEADPGLDIDGHDTAHKAVILASLAFGFNVPMDAVSVEGIRGVTAMDIRHALDFGYRIKLLAVIKRVKSRRGIEIEVRVQPALVPVDHVLASVKGVFNAVMVHGDLSGDTLYYGRGAGREPTAGTVIGDICDVATNLVTGASGRIPPITRSPRPIRIRAIEDIEARYYLRLTVLDKPGVLAHFASILGNHGISIAAVLQKASAAGAQVGVLILTHLAQERNVADAIREIDAQDFVGAPTVRLRIEEPS